MYRGHHLQSRIIAASISAGKPVRQTTAVSFCQEVSVTLYFARDKLPPGKKSGASGKGLLAPHRCVAFPPVPSARPSRFKHRVRPLLPSRDARPQVQCPGPSAAPPCGSVPATHRPAATAEVFVKTSWLPLLLE